MLGRPTSPRWALVATVVALAGVAGAARLAPAPTTRTHRSSS